MEAIHLSRLALAGFRNYTSAELALEPGLSVFEGENGHGKSNLLEAAYLLAIAKSPRASNDRELVNWDVAQSGGHVQVLGVARQHDLTVQAQLDIEAPPPSPLGPTSFQKSLRVNGIVRTAAEFVGAINIVFFQADDLELVTGPPSVRRRYLDILISQSDAAYLKNQQRYSRVVMQRNQLLRRIREGQANMDELEFWDSRLAHEGAAIVERRQKAVDDLVTHATPVHENLSSGGALRLDYRPRVSGTARDPRTGSDFGTASVADNILNALLVGTGTRGCAGCHRDRTAPRRSRHRHSMVNPQARSPHVVRPAQSPSPSNSPRRQSSPSRRVENLYWRWTTCCPNSTPPGGDWSSTGCAVTIRSC